MSTLAVDDENPSPESVLLEWPLYRSVARRPGDGAWIRTFRLDRFQFDTHCIYCKSQATFKVEKSAYTGTVNDFESYAARPGFFDVKANCTRNSHQYHFSFLLLSTSLQKIGQFPSLESIAGADIEKYRAQLKGGAFAELTRATGLASHGIGIGAFVYLRRIFERLIYEHYRAHEKAAGPVEGFDGLRMDEKIAALKAVLPAAVVKHRAIYAILSKGLHELSEDECKDFFPVVRAAIIQMLEEDWHIREKRRAEAELGRIHIQRSQSMMAARWTKAR